MDRLYSPHIEISRKIFYSGNPAPGYGQGTRGLLGEAGGLLDEFNEIYRAYHVIIGRKIDVFFDMGFHKAETLAEE